MNLDEQISYASNMGIIPKYITGNLNPNFALRPYQKQALDRFLQLTTTYSDANKHYLFHMATGSGKTLIMAGCILHLYYLGYRNFIFFVNSSTIIEKTKDNFLNANSAKYLFHQNIQIHGQQVNIMENFNFQSTYLDDINIVFTTIQGLHSKLNYPSENSITYEDFEDKKIVLISDEAHHINAETKKGQLNKEETESIESWEKTVKNIFSSNTHNILLELTATVDFNNPMIAEKYRDKLIFDYSLKQFRLDKFSKEVHVLQANIDPFSRAMQAVLLSQYRKKLFLSHGLDIQPILLFKSKTIAESQHFYNDFHKKLDRLKNEDLINIVMSSQNNVVQKAWDYFMNKDIEIPNLILELQEDFSESKCIIINSKSDNEDKHYLLNNLEQIDNPCRIIFAVDKLNEGWDVLNLFDIVRVSEHQTTGHKVTKVSQTTLSEAQLIGRGARYCPFSLSTYHKKHERKFDDFPDHPMKICEELYYHAAYNPSYINDLSNALVQIGIQSDKALLKDSLKHKKLSTNKKTDENSDVLGKTTNFNNSIMKILEIERKVQFRNESIFIQPIFEKSTVKSERLRTMKVCFKDIDVRTKQKALQKIPFYDFDNLKVYFPELESKSHFISSDNYLNKLKIVVEGIPSEVHHFSNKEWLVMMVEALEDISKDLYHLWGRSHNS